MQANEIKIAERGEQWRLLSVGEVIERGDEYLARLPDHWIASESSGDLFTNSNVIYRRRIEPRPVAKPIPEFVKPIPGRWYELQHLTGRFFCVGKNESGKMMFHSEDCPSLVLWRYDSIQILREYAETESISRAEAAENQSYADLAASGGIVDAP